MTVDRFEDRLAALELPKKERNSEGWSYIVASVCATIVLYYGMIDPMVWGVVILGDTVAYGVGRVLLKMKETV